MTASHPLWDRYDAAMNDDDDELCEAIREAWELAYDDAAAAVGEDAPDDVFNAARNDAALNAL